MKTGAAALDILQPGSILVENAASTLGLGWLGAVVMLSGSPMAATSLTLVAAAEERQTGLSEIEGFTMVMGSASVRRSSSCSSRSSTPSAPARGAGARPSARPCSR